MNNYVTPLFEEVLLRPAELLAGEDLLNGVTQIPVYVPAGSVSAYKSASGWKTYATWISAR